MQLVSNDLSWIIFFDSYTTLEIYTTIETPFVLSNNGYNSTRKFLSHLSGSIMVKEPDSPTFVRKEDPMKAGLKGISEDRIRPYPRGFVLPWRVAGS